MCAGLFKIRNVNQKALLLLPAGKGDVSEWLKEHAWKVCIRETVS